MRRPLLETNIGVMESPATSRSHVIAGLSADEEEEAVHLIEDDQEQQQQENNEASSIDTIDDDGLESQHASLPSGQSTNQPNTNNGLQFLTGFSIALCNAVDAVETTAFGSVLVSYVDPSTGKRLDEDQNLSGLLTSGVFIGMLLGGLIAGRAADIYGRRPILLISMILNAVSALLSALCPYFPGREVLWLLVFRIMAGVGVGGSVPCAFSLMAEWSPDATRGYYVSLLNGSWTVGLIFTAIAAWGLLDPNDNSKTWPVFLFVCSLPAFLAFGFTKRYVSEAPKSVSPSKPRQNEDSFDQQQEGLFSMKLFTFAIVWFVQSFGSYGVTTWIGDVFHELGFKDPFAVSFAFAVASIPGTIIAVLFVERIGRKYLLVMGMLGSGVSAMSFSAFSTSSAAAVLCACLFNVCVTLAWVGLGVMSSESFAFKHRTTSMGIAAAFGRFGSITANLVNPFLLKMNAILTVAGLVMIVGSFVSGFFLTDLTGKQLDR